MVESVVFNYAFIVTALSLLLGIPMVAYGIYKCMCKLFRFMNTLYEQQKIINLCEQIILS